jgi:protein-tyrosine phosphatase
MGFEDVGIHVLRVPLDDVVNPTTSDLRRAAGAAKEVAKLVRSGRRVLVTCAMGLNRSGLVNALALRELTGASGVHCSAHVQNKRKGALSNPTFQRLLESLAAKNVQ